MSFLHLENLKFSDYQNLCIGLYGTYLYFLLTAGRPVKALHNSNPQSNIFNRYFWSSLLGQFIIQLVTMLLLRGFAKKYTLPSQRKIDNEEEFVPTLMNSCMFLNELSSFLSTNLLNFEGRPFMKSLSEYKGHFKLIIAPLILLFVLIFNTFPSLNFIF